MGSCPGESTVLCTAFWNTEGGADMDEKIRSLVLIKCEIRNSIEDTELAVDYISLVFRAETGTGGLISKSSGIGSI